jgi:TPR repeat protein
MVSLLLLYTLFVKPLEIEHILSEECDIEKAIPSLEGTSDPIGQVYLYLINKVFLGNHEVALVHLIASQDSSTDYFSLIYAFNSYLSFLMPCNHKEVAELYLGVATKVYKRFITNRKEFKSKNSFNTLAFEDNIRNTVEHVLNLINSGDKKAEDTFIKFIKMGKVDPSSYIKVLRGMAERGCSKAMGILGEMYLEGNGVEKCYNTAMHYFTEGVNKKDAVCYNGMGRIFSSDEYQDYLLAKKYFEEGSKRGLPEADYNLFVFFRDVYKVEDMGMGYLLSAANKGYLPAIYEYALKLYKKENYKHAILYLNAICDYSEDLSRIQEKADYTFLNRKYKLSLFYLLLASEMGSTHSINNALYLLETFPGLIGGQDALIFDMNKKICEMGYKTNLVRLGDCYFYGKGTEQSYADAFSFYLSACLSRLDEGYYSLGYMYEYGLGCVKDLRSALKYTMKIKNKDAYLVVWYVCGRLCLKILISWIFKARIGIIVGAGLVTGYSMYKRGMGKEKRNE